MSTATRSDRLDAPSMSRCARVLSSVVAFSLVLPPALAHGQDPASPPPPPPTSSADTLSPAPVDPQPTTPSATADMSSGDEYETLRRTLPPDYDINYTFTEQARKRKRDNDPGHAAKTAARMGIAGGTLTLVGLIGAIATVSAGLVVAKKAEDDFNDLVTDDMISGMPDYDKRAELLKKGESGDLTAIIGGAVSGAALAVGLGLLFGARSMRKRTYGPTADTGTPAVKTGSKPPLAPKTRTNLAIYGTLLGLYGVIAIAAGAVLVGKDDDKKKRNGAILLASGGVMAAIALPMFIVLAVDKSRRNTARLNFGPTFVRRGGGAQLTLRF